MQTAVLALIGLASLLAGFLIRLILPGLQFYSWGILALGGVLIGISVVLDFRRVGRALASRRGRFGVGAIVRVSLFAGIILLVNALSVGIYHRFDLTGLSQFTLTSQTKKVLADLDEPVEIVSFFTPAVPLTVRNYAENLLNEYQDQSDQLTVREIDPELNPDRARQYQVGAAGATYGVIVFRSGEGQRKVYGPQITEEAEHAFTSAILEVTGTRQKKVYFTTGHGESGIYSDYDSARNGLRDNLFQVQEVDLLRTGGIPADAAALVVAGPQQPFESREVEILRTYLHNGGRVFLLTNPNPQEWLRQLLDEMWIDIEDGTIIDADSHVAPDTDTPLIPRTQNSFGLAETYFPGATALFAQSDLPDTVEMAPMAWTSERSWLEMDLVPGEEPRFNGEDDYGGPLAVGMIVSAPMEAPEGSGPMRLVVIGDSDFAANAHFLNGGNSALFLSAVSWLTDGKELISVDRKVLPVRRLILGPEQARFLHISSIGLLPLFLLLLAGYLWWRRR